MLVRLARQVISRQLRNYATAATNDPSKIRNIALVAHIGVVYFQPLELPKLNNYPQTPERPL
jgi:hypothetical protein